MNQYRILLAQNAIWRWSVVHLITRFPAAAAPIMFVMLSRTELGQYSVGAWMAAACVFTEAIAAPVLGTRADHKPIAPDARLSLAVAASSLIALAVGVTTLPPWVLIILAALMGGSIAGLIGSLRVLLTRSLDEEALHVGLSWDSVITNLTFAVSPLLVTSLALTAGGRWPLILAAAGCVFAALWLGRIPGIAAIPEGSANQVPEPRDQRRWRILLHAWPIYLTSAVAMFLSGAIEISVSPLIEQNGYDIRWAGAALSGFSVAAVAGGLVYGLRKWPGGYRTQCLLFLALTCLFVAISAVSVRTLGLVGIMVPLAAAGFAQSCLVAARNLSLHEAVPERYLSAGNSVLYSSSCVGFGLSSALTGWFADRGAVVSFVVVSCAIAGALALVSTLAESKRASTPTRKELFPNRVPGS